MTEPRRFNSYARFVEAYYKTPTPDPSVYELQSRAYMGALEPGDYTVKLGGYSQADVAFTLQWWNQYKHLAGGPVLINKLRGGKKYSAVWDLNDLIHPETLAKMTRPFESRLFAYPHYGLERPW